MDLEEVYKQIDAEAKAIVTEGTGYDPDTDEELGQYKPKLVDFQLRVRYYKKGASPYALKWQAAERRAEIAELKLESKRNVIDALQRQIGIDGDKIERYKKVLQDIARQYKIEEMDANDVDGDIGEGYDKVISVAREALTPKTTTDDTANG